MNPSILSYTAIGSLGFMLISVLATKYKDEEVLAKHLARDAVAGGLFTAFLLTLVPDIFPPLSLFTSVGGAITAATAVATSTFKSGGDDYDLQVGPMRRR
jgi:hypothetical protein